MSSVPEEIYHEILLRLPVESLLVCKSVCRNWYALITSSDFVKSHFDPTVQKKNPILIVSSYDTKRLYSIDYDSLVSAVHEYTRYPMNDHKIDYPFKSLGYDVELLASCNGLVCVRSYSFIHGKQYFCLWNPATREYKEIPKLPFGFDNGSVGLLGLGYGHKIDDYKLVIGVEARGSKDIKLLYIYTLSSNSWKIKRMTPLWNTNDIRRKSGVVVNGNLHWVVLGQNDMSLWSLDVNDENFKEMQLPKELLVEVKDRFPVLGVLKGCLCIFVGAYVNGVHVHSELWVMLDYGNQESWTRRYIITNESIFRDHRFFTMIWSFEDDKILFTSAGFVILYDSEHGSSITLNIFDFFCDFKYFGSLMPLKSGTYVPGEG